MQPLKNFPAFYGTSSQETSTGPYPEPDRSGPFHNIPSYLSKIYFNILHPPTFALCLHFCNHLLRQSTTHGHGEILGSVPSRQLRENVYNQSCTSESRGRVFLQTPDEPVGANLAEIYQWSSLPYSKPRCSLTPSVLALALKYDDHNSRAIWGMKCLPTLKHWYRWVRIPLEYGCLRFFCVYVLLCAGRGLATGLMAHPKS
jgi:hypothetical protein